MATWDVKLRIWGDAGKVVERSFDKTVSVEASDSAGAASAALGIGTYTITPTVISTTET